MSENEAPFCSAEDWHYNACLDGPLDPYVYVLGYKRAADRLIKSIVEDRSSLDLIIFPIVYLYRHYVELSLKELVRCGCFLTPEAKTAPLNDHKLRDLWLAAKPIIEELSPELASEEEIKTSIEEAQKIIMRFSIVDGRSTAFRYAKNKDETASLPKDLRHINIRVLYEEMAKVSFVLDGAHELLAEALRNAHPLGDY